jgi:hypothetical protein
VAARSQGVGLQRLVCWDCEFEYRRGHECLFLVSGACCQVQVSATVLSLFQMSPMGRDRENLIMRPWPTSKYCTMREKYPDHINKFYTNY